MKFLIMLAIASTSYVFADTRYEVNQVLDDISSEVRYGRHTQAQLRELKRDLLIAFDNLRNGRTNPPPYPPRDRIELLCLDRDRDGRSPYVLAHRDYRTMQMIRFRSANVGERSNCLEVTNNARYFDRDILACTTSDNDGRSPWSIKLYTAQGQMAKRLPELGTLAECTRSLRTARISRDAMLFCASKDDDGRSPYARFLFNNLTGRVTTEENFRTLENCISTIR